jgi:dipeptidyl aminopeptidase/acylaminoacyl peptidase
MRRVRSRFYNEDMTMKRMMALAVSVILALPVGAVPQERPASSPRPLAVDDLFALKSVGDPQLSPDGKWIAYTIGSTNFREERSESQVWMIPAAGGEAMPMTIKGTSAGRPRWSPDGKYLSFTASRGENARTQVWALDRRGGEAQQLTEVKQGIQSYEWSPDSSRLLLVIQDPSPEELQRQQDEEAGVRPARPRGQPPWVVDRLQFKQDFTGYLDRRRNHLYVFEMSSKKLRQITSGDYQDGAPQWSPDGKQIAFVSNRGPNPDGDFNNDLWLVSADNTDMGKTMLKLTSNVGPDTSPAWSPDGKWIAYQTSTDVKNFWYATSYLALVSSAGGTPQILTQKLDRNISTPRFSPDGKWIYFLLEDSGEGHLARLAPTGGEVTRPVSGYRSVSAYELGGDGATYVRVSETRVPGELFVVEGTGLRRLTKVNDALMAQLQLSEPENIHFKSKDGTEIEGFLFKPVGYVAGMRYPTLLRIHGGPVSQYEASFNFEAQIFAANGYAVVMANPRGSSGYGQAFSAAIYADWGNKDYEDVVAGVDYAIAKGIADPDRLGIGGWSYGGMLTNYTITKTTRFKGAISGASVSQVTALYGHDHYQRHYEVELDLPWKNRAVWDRVSPFWQVEKITTPTLWICGEKDWNVPVINSEQMYQAMKRLGRETQLVVYPGEFHGIRRPAYQKDRLERYLAWYDKYVKGTPRTTAP